jgi:hypothetical protein
VGGGERSGGKGAGGKPPIGDNKFGVVSLGGTGTNLGFVGENERFV